MARVQEKALAIKLRRGGCTYKEIMEKIPSVTSKGTLSHWCNSIVLSSAELRQLEQHTNLKIGRGRFNAAMVNRKKREERDGVIIKEAIKEFENYKQDPLFCFGLALYWAEGSKTQRQFQFTNSDPRLIRIMIAFVEKYLGILKSDLKLRIYMHKVYEGENCEDYWVGETGLSRNQFARSIYKATPHPIKKNLNYKGCVRIDVSRVAIWLRVIEWEKCFEKTMRS